MKKPPVAIKPLGAQSSNGGGAALPSILEALLEAALRSRSRLAAGLGE